MIVQLIAAFIGSLGFGIVMKIKGRQIFYAGIGGVVTWFIYLEAYALLESYFISNFIAAVFVAIFAEIMARINKTPTTIFLTAAAITLIPGGKLYYAMHGLLNEDNQMFVESGTTAATIAVAISVGFMAVTVVMKFINRFMKRRRERKRNQNV